MAPFTPFFCETMYQNLRRALPQDAPQSVHWCDFPEAAQEQVCTCASAFPQHLAMTYHLQIITRTSHITSVIQLVMRKTIEEKQCLCRS